MGSRKLEDATNKLSQSFDVLITKFELVSQKQTTLFNQLTNLEATVSQQLHTQLELQTQTILKHLGKQPIVEFNVQNSNIGPSNPNEQNQSPKILYHQHSSILPNSGASRIHHQPIDIGRRVLVENPEQSMKNIDLVSEEKLFETKANALKDFQTDQPASVDSENSIILSESSIVVHEEFVEPSLIIFEEKINLISEEKLAYDKFEVVEVFDQLELIEDHQEKMHACENLNDSIVVEDFIQSSDISLALSKGQQNFNLVTIDKSSDGVFESIKDFGMQKDSSIESPKSEVNEFIHKDTHIFETKERVFKKHHTQKKHRI